MLVLVALAGLALLGAAGAGLRVQGLGAGAGGPGVAPLPLAETSAPSATPTASATPGPDLPDLVPLTMWIEFESGSSCDWQNSRFGMRVVVANRGPADAGPFVVDLNEGQARETAPGLAAGSETRLFLYGYLAWEVNVLVVDAEDEVAESDEGNNTLALRVPIPTAPVTCTPTPSPTPGLLPRVYLPALLRE